MALISICFAVYQNEGALTQLYEKIAMVAGDEGLKHHQFEFLFVNDGSSDNSYNELLEIKKRTGDKRIKIISFSRNFGQMAAILAGWRYAKGEAVINMAADLQDPPEQCVPMIKEWEKGNDIVISYRRTHKTSYLNRLTSRIAFRFLTPNGPKGGFDFALLGRKAMNAINTIKQRNRSYHYDIMWAGFDVKFIPYDKLARTVGESQFNFTKRLRDFLITFINVSYLPLRIMTLIGFSFALAGLVYSMRIVRAYYYDGTPFEGWAPIMILLLIIGGLIMVMLGLLGEYVWRIFDEVKGRPNYVIKEMIGDV